jgi:hypothetical protein
MRSTIMSQHAVRVAISFALAVAWCAPAPAEEAKTGPDHSQRAAADGRDIRATFLRMCDLATDELNKEFSPFGDRNNTDPATHHVPFFEDSYAVRALCVAYDMTGEQKYLDACKHWSDRMIAYQDRMIPKGAYYLNYGREPGSTEGDWFVADAGCIGMAVLATAVRCDEADKQRYLDSVRALCKLVIDNYIGPGGGVTDGLWSTFDGEWWCSTATFGALAFLMHEATGEQSYLDVAQGTLDWTLGHDFRKAEYIGFEEGAPGVVFYTFEYYATALPYLKAGTPRRETALAQIDEAVQWMEANQKGRGATTKWEYFGNSTYMGGMPYIMYVLAERIEKYRDLRPAADKELRYILGLLFADGDPPVSQLTTWELMTWAMFSCAERECPGCVLKSPGRPVAPATK